MLMIIFYHFKTQVKATKAITLSIEINQQKEQESKIKYKYENIKKITFRLLKHIEKNKMNFMIDFLPR